MADERPVWTAERDNVENNCTYMPVTSQAHLSLRNGVPNLASDRVWTDAPPAVMLAYGIAVASTGLYTLVAGGVIGDIILRDRAIQDVSLQHFLLLGLSSVLALVNLWLVAALRNGRPLAWHVQKVLSIASLVLLPVGTALHLLLLLRWSRFESKAWFIVR